MKQKTKNLIFNKIEPMLKKITQKEFPNLNTPKITNFWINTLDWFYKITTSIIFTLAWVWWFPQYIKHETIIVILLCIIIIEIRLQNQ